MEIHSNSPKLYYGFNYHYKAYNLFFKLLQKSFQVIEK